LPGRQRCLPPPPLLPAAPGLLPPIALRRQRAARELAPRPQPPRCPARRSQSSRAAGLVTFGIVAGNVGLLLVDGIHFQYNGVMLGGLLGCWWRLAEGAAGSWAQLGASWRCWADGKPLQCSAVHGMQACQAGARQQLTQA
jgi:hypothetical protein